MIISEHPAFLFVHIPKTAGMSMVRALSEGSVTHPLCHPTTKHEILPDFIRRNGRAAFDRYTSFAVVRHPLDRFLSRFAFTSTRQTNGRDDAHLFKNVDTFIDAIERSDPQLMARPERYRCQHEFITLDGSICIEFVLRFENLKSDFAALCLRLRLPPRELPWENSSDRSVALATPRVKAFVRRYYARDFDLFGYS